MEHRRFSDILAYLSPGDLLVVNETKVMPARLVGIRAGGGEGEALLLRRLVVENERQEQWEALVRPGRRLRPGAVLKLGPLTVDVIGWPAGQERGQRVVRLTSEDGTSCSEALNRLGQLPLPPYITGYEGDRSYYQTVYAKNEESAAAPTAGLHFTPELLGRIREAGVRIEAVDLAVGLDTFRPIEEERIQDHAIHTERYSVSAEVIEALSETRQKGGRVVAVGTTSVRSLESAWDEASGSLLPRMSESTSLYITPGYRFRAVDAMITNFHAPRSTLLALVSAFASHSQIMAAYNEALAKGYRFLSFGDAMLMV